MKINQRSIVLVAILTTIVLVVGTSSILLLYKAALKQQSQQLLVTTTTNAHLIESVARFDQSLNLNDQPQGYISATLSQVKSSQTNMDGFGKTGEFIFAKRVDNQMVFLFKTRHSTPLNSIKTTEDGIMTVPITDSHTVPMQHALNGESGTIVAPDYRGKTVIAAYAPIKVLNYGLVAKIDLSEIRAPFIQAAWISIAIALLLIAVGSYLYLRLNKTSIELLKESERYNRLLFESSPVGLALCRMDGSLVDINAAYAGILGRGIEETKALSYWDITPKKYESQEVEQLKSLHKKGHYGPYEKEYIHKNGSLVAVSLIGQLIDIKGETFIWSSIEDISQRIAIQKELLNSIEFSRKTICAAPVGMAIFDQTGQCIEANQAIADIVGAPKEVLLKQNYHNLESWKQSGIDKMASKTIQNGTNERLEKRIVTTFGNDLFLEVLTSSYEVNGQIYLLVLLKDISQRKATENALTRSEETFARAQAIANIGNWDWDITTGNISWTDEVFRIFGLSPQAFTPSYEAFLKRVHPEDVESVTDGVNKSIAEDVPYNVEHRVIQPSGNIRVVHEQGVVYRKDGEPVRMIGTVHDITQLREADAAHRQQVERNEMILKTTQDGYWIVSPTGHLLEVNDAYCRMSGFSREELIGKAISQIDVDHTDAKVQQNIERLENEGYIQFETRHYTKNSGIINIEVASSLAQLGDETFLIAFFKNITERKQTEHQLALYRDNLKHLVSERTQELRDAQEELVRKERLATLGQLTATVSHELRNPLSAMGPSLYILNKLCPTEEPKIKKAIEILHRSVSRCDHIVDDLLDFTRITSVQEEQIVIDNWLATLISEQLNPYKIEIETHFNIGTSTCNFDPNGLRRAVINVFENGCQAMINQKTDKPLSRAKMTVSTQIKNDRIEIIMTDTGSGMSEYVLGKIFEPLYSTKVYGVGLGMPTIKQIMEQHKGGIEISSIENRGTTATLWLPCPESSKNQIEQNIEEN